jgi:DivIVA domain-containing protein
VNPPARRSSGIRAIAQEVRDATFNRSPLGWRGYSEDEVDGFLAHLVRAMDQAEHEQAALHAEIDRLRNFYRDRREDVDRTGRRPGHVYRPSFAGLIDPVCAYTEVQLELAQEFASMVAGALRPPDPVAAPDGSRVADAADALLYQARIRSVLAVEEAVRLDPPARAEDGGPAPGPAEIQRTVVWLRAFGYALQIQVDGATDTLRAALAE